MDAARFHNALRILINLDGTDLFEAGIADENWGEPVASDRDQICAFMDNPTREALRMPDANFDRLFALIESRQPTAEAKPAPAIIPPVFEDRTSEVM